MQELPADVVVVNSCTVTAVADKKSRQLLRQARRGNPAAVIVLCGCYADTAAEALGLADIVVGVRDKDRLCEIVQEFLRERSAEIIAEPTDVADTQLSRHRATLKIQDGCNCFCSYCIIPHVRSSFYSMPLDEVAAAANNLAAEGYKELVFVGINLAKYEYGLVNAARAAADSAISRIRVSSLDPMIFTPEFYELLHIQKLCPHLHISLQSGCDATLARMNRQYTFSDYAAIVRRLRDILPDIAITTDVIVGFPGESESEFAESLANVQSIGFSDMHIFPYSRRKGTAAYDMQGQIPQSVKHERLLQLEKVAAQSKAAYAARFIGTRQPVLLEQKADGMWQGYTPHYLRTRVAVDESYNAGDIVEVEIESFVL